MSTPHAHMRYRRSVYRKRKIRIIVITTLCVLAVLAILFIIIGNVLGNKVSDRIPTYESSGNKSATDEHVVVKDVNAYPVLLEQAGSQLGGRIDSAVSKGYSDVCFSLTDASGALMYASPTAKALGKQIGAENLRSPEEVAKVFSDKGVYSIAVLYATELENDNALLRSAAMGYYAALCAELLSAGINEVLIYVQDVPVDTCSELITLASEIHRLSEGKGYVGLSLPSTVFSHEQNAELVTEVWNEYDYLAVDLCKGETADQIGDELATMLYDLIRRNVRVLVPNTSDTELNTAIKQVVTSKGAKSIQIMP